MNQIETSPSDAARSYSGSSDYRVVLGFGPTHCLILPRGLSLEVLLDLEAVPLPGAPPWWRGLVGVRGEILPVLQLASPWRESPAGREQLILLRGAHEAVVLATEAQPGFAAQRSTTASTQGLPEALAAWCGDAVTLEGSWESGWEWDAFAHLKALATTAS